MAGWPVVFIGVLSIISGIGYTGGPFPLAYNGLGDLFVLTFFGFVAVCGTVYVQALAVPELARWAGGLVGALSTAILVVNNVRDVDTDRAVGKRTLPVLLSRRAGQVEYAVLVGICTHLGCSPTYRPEVAPADLGDDWKGGFFCPCHGSNFDLAGRVYKGVPAPTNLVVPPHQYLSENVILIGVDGGAA